LEHADGLRSPTASTEFWLVPRKKGVTTKENSNPHANSAAIGARPLLNIFLGKDNNRILKEKPESARLSGQC